MIRWYSGHSRGAQRLYKWLKAIVILFAAGIPVSTAVGASSWVAAVLGGLIVVLEGIQQLNQYHDNWIAYRSTAEALKHEKFLFLPGGGPYADSAQPSALLAETVEELVSQQHSKWLKAQDRETKSTAAPTGGA